MNNKLFVFTRARFGFDDVHIVVNKDVGVESYPDRATPAPIWLLIVN